MKILLCFLIFSAYSSFNWALEDNQIATSLYTKKIQNLSVSALENLSKKQQVSNDFFSIKCLKTLNDANYIGLLHALMINAKMKDVGNLIENFNNYQNIFKGIKHSEIREKYSELKYLIQFENESPVFFLSNIRYQMLYEINNERHFKVYRYFLSTHLPQNNLFFSDGIILIKEYGEKTLLYELDFFKPNLGLAGNFFASKVWPSSVKELLLSDLELKLKAENKDESFKTLSKKATEMLDEKLINECLEHSIFSEEIFPK